MSGRFFLAGILGGVVMFIWTSIAHMALPLGGAGVRELPNESTVLAALQSNLGESHGLYMFPGMGLGSNPTREQKNAAMKEMVAKLATNPSGLLVYHPPGRVFNLGQALGIEFLTEVAEALLVVFLLAQTRLAGFGGRVGFAVAAGILVAISTHISYWNWDGFPKRYTASYMFIQLVGFFLVGLVVALVLRKTPPRTT